MKLISPVTISILLLGLGLKSCGGTKIDIWQEGDLFFCGTTSSDLSKAIDVVTQSGNHNYSHVGILARTNNGFTVIHAYPEVGVCEEPLDSFIEHRHRSGSVVHAYRIVRINTTAAQRAIGKARQAVGQPYNFTYIMSDTGYYCSELVYEAFALDSVFNLNPMSFRDPETGEIPAAWLQHYKELGIHVPEGLPGCNPNGMADDDDLVFLGEMGDRPKDTK